MRLTYKQKEEQALKYLKGNKISFGNQVAEEAAIQMFIDAMTLREDTYEHTIQEFKESHLWMLKATWDEMYKYLSNEKTKNS